MSCWHRSALHPVRVGVVIRASSMGLAVSISGLYRSIVLGLGGFRDILIPNSSCGHGGFSWHRSLLPSPYMSSLSAVLHMGKLVLRHACLPSLELKQNKGGARAGCRSAERLASRGRVLLPEHWNGRSSWMRSGGSICGRDASRQCQWRRWQHSPENLPAGARCRQDVN